MKSAALSRAHEAAQRISRQPTPYLSKLACHAWRDAMLDVIWKRRPTGQPRTQQGRAQLKLL